MKLFMAKLLKVIIAFALISVYLIFVYVALMGGKELGIVEIVRHVIFVTGLVPLCSWMALVFFAKTSTSVKLALLAVGVSVYHVFLFAVSAHSDDEIYWVAQMVEFVFLWAIVRLVRNTRGGDVGVEPN